MAEAYVLTCPHGDDATHAGLGKGWCDAGLEGQRRLRDRDARLAARDIPTPEFVLDLLSSDGQPRPGDEHLTGLADALRTLARDLQQDVAAALYTYAVERVLVAAEAEQRAKLITPEEFRDRNLMTAERLARLWREATHAR